MGITYTYKMAKRPPPPMAWDVYEDRVKKEWSELLDADPPKPERDIQDFLQRHPSMVPGAHLTSGAGVSGHDPFPPTLIAQPRLNGLQSHIPDFMWLAKDSATLSPVFIEVECPNKKWFTKSGQPTAKFTQAQTQIKEWELWIKQPAQQQLFKEYYAIDGAEWHRLDFCPQYILIYGRRSEFIVNDELNKRRNGLAHQDEHFMTFDRLSPDRSLREMLCARVDTGRTYRAITWPPVATLSPNYAPSRVIINDIDTAIQSSEWITEERRLFLRKRLPYWVDWARSGGSGPVNGTHKE